MNPFAFGVLLSLAGTATSPFNGTWLIDIPSSIADAEPETYVVGHRRFRRGGTKSGVAVRADGRFHKIPSDGYVDEVAVLLLGPRTVRELDHLNGKLVYDVIYSVSADGRTMTRSLTDYSKPDGHPVPTTVTHRRVGAPRRGVPLLSGRWRVASLATTKSHLTEVLKLDGDRFTMSGPGGVGYAARIGGQPVPMVGDAADARAAVAMPDERNIVVEMSRGGEATATMKMTMQPGQRTIRVAARRRDESSDTTWLMHRQ